MMVNARPKFTTSETGAWPVATENGVCGLLSSVFRGDWRPADFGT